MYSTDDIIKKLSEHGVKVVFAQCSCSKFCGGNLVSEEKYDGYILDFKEHDSKVTEKMRCEILQLEDKNKKLEKENADIQNSHLQLYNDSKDEIRGLKAEIERLRVKCGEVPCERCDCEHEEIDLEALVYELQDQHQQDCIRYNDMRTAFLKTVDELAMLRKQFGVGQ